MTCFQSGLYFPLLERRLIDRTMLRGPRPATDERKGAVMADDLKRPSSLEALMQSRIARLKAREYDWDALKFQADFDPKYRRAQLRYIGTGGTGVAADDNAVPAEHFTFSTMLLPAGCEGPLHVHTDVEEVFFMMRGQIDLFFERDG
ncbi:MAG: hypothetical protein ACREFI_19965, partial [Stellaceae bacterium]